MAHVGAEFGHEGGCRDILDARDGLEQPHRFLVGAETVLDLALQLRNRGFQEVEMGQDLVEQHAMIRLEVPRQGLAERGALGPHPPARQLCQHGDVLLAGEQGVEHVAHTRAQHARRDGCQLDVSTFQHLLQPIDR